MQRQLFVMFFAKTMNIVSDDISIKCYSGYNLSLALVSCFLNTYIQKTMFSLVHDAQT